MIIRDDTILTGGGTEIIIMPVNASLLKVELSEGTLTVEGNFEKNGDWYTLGAIKASDFSKSLNINSAGIYSIDISGLYSLQFTYNGSAEIKYKIIG